MLLDGITYAIEYGTMRNRHDTAAFTFPLLAHALFLGRAAGTLAGFFAMGIRSGSDELYVCHRGLNRLFCLAKADLTKRWSVPLPSMKRQAHSPIKGFFYNNYSYFNRCLGVHHGTLVET